MTNIKTFQLVVSASMYVAASSHSADKNYVNSVTLAEAVDWGEIEELGGNAGKCQLHLRGETILLSIADMGQGGASKLPLHFR